jgi:hypothetical protein
MRCVQFIANGFCKEPRDVGDYYGRGKIRIWNPVDWETGVNLTVYYADKAPTTIPEFRIKAGGNPLLDFPRDYPDVFDNCGAWGMKILSETPLIIDHVFAAGRQGPPGNVKYSGASNDNLTKTRLSCLWYFADGLVLVWDPEKAPLPFNELEWYHILNPNKEPVDVAMRCYYSDGSTQEFSYRIESERVLMIENHPLVKINSPYGIRFVSTLPVVVESERLHFGLHGFEEWGAHIHCPRPGIPAPLVWNEDCSAGE